MCHNDWIHPLLFDQDKNLMAKQLFTYLFCLRSTNFAHATAITDDVMVFDVKNDEDMS
jgi:hypothetical protein